LEQYSAWPSYLSRNPEVRRKPCSPFIKINYNIAIQESFSAQAAVLRDSSGTITHCSSFISPPCVAIYGEALAALLVAKLALSLHTTFFILEGDSLTVILALQNPIIT
jgi:hypothetical protein